MEVREASVYVEQEQGTRFERFLGNLSNLL
jgi:hypothetical protein